MTVKKGVEGAVKKQNIDIASFRMVPGEVWRQGSGVPVGRIVGICVEIVSPLKKAFVRAFYCRILYICRRRGEGRYWMCRSRRKKNDRAVRIAVT